MLHAPGFGPPQERRIQQKRQWTTKRKLWLCSVRFTYRKERYGASIFCTCAFLKLSLPFLVRTIESTVQFVLSLSAALLHGAFAIRNAVMLLWVYRDVGVRGHPRRHRDCPRRQWSRPWQQKAGVSKQRLASSSPRTRNPQILNPKPELVSWRCLCW